VECARGRQLVAKRLRILIYAVQKSDPMLLLLDKTAVGHGLTAPFCQRVLDFVSVEAPPAVDAIFLSPGYQALSPGSLTLSSNCHASDSG